MMNSYLDLAPHEYPDVTKPRVVVFNGPPGAGKDTAARLVMEYGRQCVVMMKHDKFSMPMKQALPVVFGVPFVELEQHKDKPHPALFGKTFAEVQISMSEKWMKKEFGDDVFGLLAAHRISSSKAKATVHVFSDGGFAHEVFALCGVVPYNNILLVRMHRDGCSFLSSKRMDSRSYLYPVNLPAQHDLFNNGPLSELEVKLGGLMNEWLALKATP